MAMNKNAKTALYIGVAVVLLYLGYRWYQNRQQNPNNTGAGLTSDLGTNLNSVNPFVDAAAGPQDTGLNYNGGTVNIDVTEPVEQPPKPHPKPPPKPHKPPGHLIGGGNPPHVPIGPIRHRIGGITPIPTDAVTSRTTHPRLNATPHSISNRVVRTPSKGKPPKRVK